MTLARGTTAFLALWNGISDAAQQHEYESWHTFEHVPERVGLPGFLEARRYRCVDTAQPLYFTWYLLDSLAAMNHPQYQQVFAQPTAWTARMRVRLTNFLRLPCTLHGAHGESSAGRLAALHLRARDDAGGHALERELASRVARGDLVCAHWGAYAETSSIPIANRQDAAEGPQPGRDLVVLLQAIEWEGLRRQAGELAAALAVIAPAVRAPEYFELLSAVRRDGLAGPTERRQPPRDDLYELFTSGDKA
jgi:hypothetical protein